MQAICTVSMFLHRMFILYTCIVCLSHQCLYSKQNDQVACTQCFYCVNINIDLNLRLSLAFSTKMCCNTNKLDFACPIYWKIVSIIHQLLVIGRDTLIITSWNPEYNLMNTFQMYCMIRFFLALQLVHLDRSLLYALAQWDHLQCILY